MLLHANVIHRAMDIYNLTGTESEEFETAALESKIWSLLHILLTFRTASEPDKLKIHPFSSNAVIQEKYLREHKQAREHWLILSWIQDSLDTPEEPPELRGAKWMYTRNAIQQKQRTVIQPKFVTGQSSTIDIVTQIDADAQLRQGKPIAQEDEQFDRTIFKYIFNLIRARKYNEACKVCEHTGNWTLLLALKGQDEYYDPEIEGHILGESAERRGIQNKMLWRRMCWKLTKAENLDPYERGIYGILSSDLESVLSLSDTWELQLLAFMSYLVATESEEAMKGFVDSDVESMHIPKSSFSSSYEILQILAHSANPEIKKQSKHILRQFLGSIINDDITSIIDALASNINSLMEGLPNIFSAEDTMKVLRIATHLILFLQQLSVNVGESGSYSVIIDAYIELLRGEGKNDLIPLYVSYLSDDLASDTYSYLLATITDSEERKQHLHLAKKYGLDMPNTIRKAVKRVFDEDPTQYQQYEEIKFTSEVTQNDLNLCHAVAWYKEATMWPDAIHSCVTLYRLFLGVGKIQSASEFGEAVPWAFILNKYEAYLIGRDAGPITLGIEEDTTPINEAFRLEFSEYGRLVSCIQQIHTWNDHYANASSQELSFSTKDRRGSAMSNGSIANGSKKREHTQLWKRDAIHIVTSLSDTVHQLARTWMTSVLNSPDADQETIEQVTRLRTWYIPFLLMELLRVFIEAQEAQFNFLRQAAGLATFVADEDLKIYQLFIANGSLNAFLGGIADACADGVIRGEEGIFE